MTRVILERELLAKLNDVKERLEVCDETGKTLGYLIPTADRVIDRQVEIPFKDAELDGYAREPGGRPLPEILADLERGS